MENKNEVLLKVEHLCQYFKMGRKQLKAVDDVSFEIKKGEVFGLVGESGCGKTTTGRSIIKLYDITGGDVYFKNRRICAGTIVYKNAIAKAKKEAKAKIEALTKDCKEGKITQEFANGEIQKIKQERDAIISEQHKLKSAAVHDHKYGDQIYAEELVKDLDKEYEFKFKEVEGDEEATKKLRKKYRHDRHVAKNSRFITQIQMIFQDPIASLDPRMTVREIISEGLVIKGIKDKEYIDNKVYEILNKKPNQFVIKNNDILVAIYELDLNVNCYRAVRVWN